MRRRGILQRGEEGAGVRESGRSGEDVVVIDWLVRRSFSHACTATRRRRRRIRHLLIAPFPRRHQSLRRDRLARRFQQRGHRRVIRHRNERIYIASRPVVELLVWGRERAWVQRPRRSRARRLGRRVRRLRLWGYWRFDGVCGGRGGAVGRGFGAGVVQHGRGFARLGLVVPEEEGTARGLRALAGIDCGL